MDMDGLRELLGDKMSLERAVSEVSADPALIGYLLDMVNGERGAIKFACTKVVRLMSEREPEKVYPYFDDIYRLTESRNSFIKWDALLTIANLAAVDSERRFDGIYEAYFGLIHAPDMITAATVIGSAWKIAIARPEWEADITRRLMDVSSITYCSKGEPSPECGRIACGNVIDSFDMYFDSSCSKARMISFAESQIDCERRSVAKKAESFLRRHKCILCQ